METKIKSVIAKLSENRKRNNEANTHSDGSLEVLDNPPSYSFGDAHEYNPKPNISSAKHNLYSHSKLLSEEEEKAKIRKAKMLELRKAATERVEKKKLDETEEQKQKRALEMQQLERERKEHKKERLKVQAKREALVKKVAYSRHIGAGRDDDDLFKSKCQLAVSHYSKNLMIKYGLSPWVQYVALLRDAHETACKYHADVWVERCFICWKEVYTMSQLERRRTHNRLNALAVAYYKRQLLRYVWKKWRLYRKLLKTKAKTVGGQFSRHAIRRRAFTCWRVALDKRLRLRVVALRTVAIPHGRKVVFKYYLCRWKNYLSLCRVDREIQMRTDLTWSKVQGWLSDI